MMQVKKLRPERLCAMCARIERTIYNRFRSTPGYLRQQLLRAVNSTGANIAEGYARGNGRAHYFYTMALGSAGESRYHLAVAMEKSELKSPIVSKVKRIMLELAILVGAK